MTTRPGVPVTPHDVHPILKRHMLADGYPFVLDSERSHGRQLVDAKTGKSFLEMSSSFATMPVGLNHSAMCDHAFRNKLLQAAVTNPANSDMYTVEMAEFVQAWEKHAQPPNMKHYFFVAGGSIAVENALKAAFDWKVKKNFQRGYTTEMGKQILHFTGAFHGRSGYCLSLTNTADPRKHQFFPKLDWPRVPAPTRRWPQEGRNEKEELERVQQAEEQSLDYAQLAFQQRVHDIAAIIIEPIQSEGGDNHFRPEFLQALRQLADKYEALLIFDEVQTGIGLTGKMWAFQHFGVTPDLLVFGKKSQVCGVMAGPRIDEIPNNVFQESSRINSTFGGNLADMVRCQRYLEIMANEKLVQNAATVGRVLLTDLRLLQLEAPENTVTNARGLGLMCAIDFATPIMRDQIIQMAYDHDPGMILLPCGQRSIRFRPALNVTGEEVHQAVHLLSRCIAQYKNTA